MDLSYFRLVHELLRLMFEFMNFSVFPWTKCGFMNICNKVHELMDFLYKVHELGYSSWMLPTGSWTWWTIVNTAFMNCIHEPIWWTFDEFWQIIHVQFMNNSWMFISSWMFMNCISPGKPITWTCKILLERAVRGRSIWLCRGLDVSL